VVSNTYFKYKTSFNLENSNQEFLLSIFVENENTFDDDKSSQHYSYLYSDVLSDKKILSCI